MRTLDLPDVELAQEFAMHAHAGQVDKAGRPYYLHVLRVSGAGRTVAEQIVGALHDTLEDTRTTRLEIKLRFGAEILDGVVAMTKLPSETYMDFIRRAADNPIARQVKKYDLHDNVNRLGMLPDKIANTLRRRYNEALDYLDSLG